MARKKKITCVFDTETAGTLARPLVYDLGLVITDKEGNSLHEQRWIVEEIFDNKELMDTAYYAHKLPTYYPAYTVDPIKKPFYVIIAQLRDILAEYEVDVIAAYNLGFDLRAMSNTHQELIGKKFGKKPIWKEGKNGKFSPDYQEMFVKRVLKADLTLLCIWCYACEVIFPSKTFYRMADKHNWLTEKGNYITNAEVAYKYLTGDFEFEEQHTALSDAQIERHILYRCEQKKKKHDAGLFFHPWRIPQKLRKAVLGIEEVEENKAVV